MATLHLMVGLPCSGKSTLARTLEHAYSALRLTPDEWQIRLFGQDAEEPEHNARHTLIETLQWEVASRALALGINVILDYGFWAREDREDFRARAKQLGASSEVHFLDVPEHQLLRRLAQRATFVTGFPHPERDDEAVDCVVPETDAGRIAAQRLTDAQQHAPATRSRGGIAAELGRWAAPWQRSGR